MSHEKGEHEKMAEQVFGMTQASTGEPTPLYEGGSLSDCPQSPTNRHQYREIASTWDWEKYECVYCGHTYKIYEEELK